MQKTLRIRKKREKLYGVFLQTECGKIYGWIEESFNMNWSPIYVRLWNKNNAEAYLKEWQKKNKHCAFLLTSSSSLLLCETDKPCNEIWLDQIKVKFFIARANSTKSPIKIDMKNESTSKFHRRNKRFQVKTVEVPEHAL